MNKNKTRYLELLLLCLTVISIVIALCNLRWKYSETAPSNLRSLKEGWYRLDNGHRIPLTLPCTVYTEDGEDLTIYYDDLMPQDAGLTISTHGALYRVKIRLGDNLLYAYNDVGFPRNEQMRSKLDCMAVLPEDTRYGSLTLVYENQGDNTFCLNPVYVGYSRDIFRSQVKNDTFNMIMVFTMAIIASVCAGAHFYMKHIHSQENRLGNCACFLLLFGAWCTLDSALMQQLTNHSSIVCSLSFYAYMTMVIPIFHFIRNTGEMGKYKSLYIAQLLFYVNVIVQLICHWLFHTDLIAMLPVTHMLQAGSCMLGTWLMWKEYRDSKNPELRTVLQSIVILAVTTMVDLCIYWGPKSHFYGFFTQCGILIFIIRLLGAILVSMAENLQFKTEALVYKRLSQEDRLTGLSNRRGYDDFMNQLEQDLDQYENVALAFLDVNRLKFINDRYGHSAGDELIIGAARCVESVFSGSGKCYRIGGDEFAAILPNCTTTEAQWQQLLDETILNYNKNNHYHLSIAFGISFLRDSEGLVKRMSDWKYEADQLMYKNKILLKSMESGKEGDR